MFSGSEKTTNFPNTYGMDAGSVSIFLIIGLISRFWIAFQIILGIYYFHLKFPFHTHPFIYKVTMIYVEMATFKHKMKISNVIKF